MRLFYQENFEELLFLDEIDSKHCIRVLRKKENDQIDVTDGAGNMFHCSIHDAHPKRTRLQIIDKKEAFGKPNRYVSVAIAPTKNIDRTEYFVEKAVEIGVSEISFIQTANSERKHLKLDRLNRIAIAGMKQSLKAYLPKMNDLMPFGQYIDELSLDATHQKFMAHLSDDSIPLEKKEIGSRTHILIGPEGDFIESEIEKARANGFEMVSMGQSRLRTETAGLVAVTLLNLL
ncbi:MAG: 16S rRNA (uracil1498-N3)-methyltransferase [Arcticibacterium sp.]|jgi:16S rRNA (uracil1498-N3)-methyltransferase